MNSTATLDVLPVTGLSPTATPLVLIEGVPAPLRVARYEAESPLDLRRVLLELAPVTSRSVATTYVGRTASLALPFVLSDESVRLLPLAHGRITTDTQASSAARDEGALLLIDDWADLAARPIAQAWRADHGSPQTVDALGESLRIGAHANRSPAMFRLAGREAHAMVSRGERWTLGDALRSIAAWAGLDLSLAALPEATADAPLHREISLSASLALVLRALMADHGLVVRIDLRWSAGAVARRLAVVPTGAAGPGSSAEIRLDRAISSRRVAAPRGARRWVTRTAGVVVESTFPLEPAWLASLELLPNSAMSPATNPAFHAVRDVFRKWALNHDGKLGAPAFDLAARFDGVAGPWRGETRFLDCVTLGADGAPLPPVVEVSFDAGVNWSAHAGVAAVLPGEFAVRFDDVTLPGAILAAGRAGTLRVRVTAGIRGPGVELSRWRGNALAGSLPTAMLDGAEAFEVRRLHPESIHTAAVADGTLLASARDDTPALRAWLEQRSAQGDADEVDVELPGVWPAVRVGDRVRDPDGSGFGGRHAVVTNLAIDFNTEPNRRSPRTTLNLRERANP